MKTWTYRISSTTSIPSANRIAFHPQERLGICLRAEHDGLMIIFDGGYRKIKINDITKGNWMTPRDHKERILPMDIRRPLLATAMGYFTVDVKFKHSKWG